MSALRKTGKSVSRSQRKLNSNSLPNVLYTLRMDIDLGADNEEQTKQKDKTGCNKKTRLIYCRMATKG